MGLDAEYTRARQWVKDHLIFDRAGYYSTFEITIRVRCGALYTYHLTRDALYLAHAADLGDRMLPASDRLAPSVNLHAGAPPARAAPRSPRCSSSPAISRSSLGGRRSGAGRRA
ncbi:hypothetical protein B0H11DRAFT_2248278 [Mycena galericulata]|nr:hypothetical protein B0H11DRAFT_2248278 [Mycena galericulata]